jgi:hypothetical protein
MPLLRNHTLVAALAAALIGAPAPAAPPRTPQPPPPPLQPAVMPQRTRLGRRWRRAAVRAIRPWRPSRLLAGMAWSRPVGLNPRPSLPARESYARGPPPGPGRGGPAGTL